jgi:hypothetical protein
MFYSDLNIWRRKSSNVNLRFLYCRFKSAYFLFIRNSRSWIKLGLFLGHQQHMVKYFLTGYCWFCCPRLILLYASQTLLLFICKLGKTVQRRDIYDHTSNGRTKELTCFCWQFLYWLNSAANTHLCTSKCNTTKTSHNSIRCPSPEVWKVALGSLYNRTRPVSLNTRCVLRMVTVTVYSTPCNRIRWHNVVTYMKHQDILWLSLVSRMSGRSLSVTKPTPW